jgi:ferritin heavy chain
MSNNFKCRQNWGEQCEQDLNKQINLELLASHQYLFLSSHFNRDDVALKPLSDFLNKCSLEERGHAQKLIDYQNMRGGIVVLTNVADPNIKFTSNNKVLEALNFVLILEKTVNKSLLDLHTTAENDNDPQFGDYIEGEFLNEQVEAISEISKYITQIEFIGNNNYGIWEFINKTFS